MLRLAIPVLRVASSAAAEEFYGRLGFRAQWAYGWTRRCRTPATWGWSATG